MKISLLVFAAAASLGAASAAEAQVASNTSRNNSRATATISRANSPTIVRQQRAARTPFIVQSSRTDGVIARTVRANDKFQLLNPAAPDSYGDGREVTRRDSDDPYQRAQGIKLVTVEF